MKAYFYGYIFEVKNKPLYGFKIIKRESEFYYADPDKLNDKEVRILKQGDDPVNDVIICSPGQVEFLWIGKLIYGNFKKTPALDIGDLVRVEMDI